MSPLIHRRESVPLSKGRSLFDYADELSIRVPTSCGRTGQCHECIVNVEEGSHALSDRTDPESFLSGTYRLACQAQITDPSASVKFSVIRRQMQILSSAPPVSSSFCPSPALSKVDGRVVTTAGGMSRYICRYTGRILGLSADIGATTVVLNLVDVEAEKTIYTASFENPQRFGGSDVMNRISYDGGRNKGELHKAIVSAINFEIGEMAKRLNIRRRQICEMTVVGNPTMRDLFFGLDVQPIGVKPYRSTIETEMLDGKRDTTAMVKQAGELGVRINPEADVYGAPLIGSHVGADSTACLVSSGMYESDAPSVLLDIGTNTEVLIGNKEHMTVASCPAGPAFEGGGIKCAMPGYDGAISTIRVSPNRETNYEVIGGGAPLGICGSGLVDLLAEFRRSGVMDELGRFEDGRDEFEFAPPYGLSLSRSDISTLAQAKAANYCGQSIALRFHQLPHESYSKFYLAGGFANYISLESATRIGFIADFSPERIYKIGNAASSGAAMLLLSADLRRHIELFCKRIDHVELETAPDFFDFFVEGCQFKPMEWPL